MVLVQRQFAEFEAKGASMWFDHHDSLELPEERIEDDEKVVTTRYTPLGVVGAIIPCECLQTNADIRILTRGRELPNHPLSWKDHSSTSHR
jgi:hypothetical protein